MIKVKISTNFPWWPLLRQTPEGDGVWGQCQFFVNQDVAECDFWIVLDGLRAPETARCRPENTLLVTCEPPDFKTYAPDFVRQFGTVLTCHKDIDHPNVILGQQGLPWMVGATLDTDSLTWKNFFTFDQLAASPSKKTKLLSVVASKKSMVPGHTKRDLFLSKLKERLGDRVDIYGMGYRPIDDKWNVIAPYKYHLAIENSVVENYWTEKLADAFIGEAYPIYSGCPNIYEYFSPMALDLIDVEQIDQSIDTIDRLITSERYLERRMEILNAKKKVLSEFNIFSVCERVVLASIKLNGHLCPDELSRETYKGSEARNGIYYWDIFSKKFNRLINVVNVRNGKRKRLFGKVTLIPENYSRLSELKRAAKRLIRPHLWHD